MGGGRGKVVLLEHHENTNHVDRLPSPSATPHTLALLAPQIAYGTTVAIRFANNVIGGEQFVDLARWAGVQ